MKLLRETLQYIVENRQNEARKIKLKEIQTESQSEGEQG